MSVLPTTMCFERKVTLWVGKLQSALNATTLTWKNGKVSITDGPYAETKEQLGGILVLEAKDLNHAIQLMLKHPGVKAEAEDLTEMIGESERRRSSPKGASSFSVT